jgi:hypothetical protein
MCTCECFCWRWRHLPFYIQEAGFFLVLVCLNLLAFNPVWKCSIGVISNSNSRSRSKRRLSLQIEGHCFKISNYQSWWIGVLGRKLRFNVKIAKRVPGYGNSLWVYSLRRLVSPGGWDSPPSTLFPITQKETLLRSFAIQCAVRKF